MMLQFPTSAGIDEELKHAISYMTFLAIKTALCLLNCLQKSLCNLSITSTINEKDNAPKGNASVETYYRLDGIKLLTNISEFVKSEEYRDTMECLDQEKESVQLLFLHYKENIINDLKVEQPVSHLNEELK